MECASAWKKFKVQYGEQGGGNGKMVFTSCCFFFICIAMFVCRVSHIDARNLKANHRGCSRTWPKESTWPWRNVKLGRGIANGGDTFLGHDDMTKHCLLAFSMCIR